MIRPPEFAIGIRFVLGFERSEMASSASDTVVVCSAAALESSESRLETRAVVPTAIAATPTSAASVISAAGEGRRLGGSSSGPRVLVRVGLEPGPGAEMVDPLESGRATAVGGASSTGATIVTASAGRPAAYGAASNCAEGNVEPESRKRFQRREWTR